MPTPALLLSLTCAVPPALHAPLDDQDAATPKAPRVRHEAPDLAEDLRVALPRLLGLMRAGIDVKEPHNSWTGQHGNESLFLGSYDWHSCIIAHFALLTHARVSGEEELAAFVLGRLGGPGLRKEVELLAERNTSRTITFPYDEAWFLMLLSELARHEGADQAAVHTARVAVESRLLEHLEESKFPDGFRDNPFCGFYRSWLFTLYLVQLAGPVTEGADGRVAALIEDRLEPQREAIEEISTSHDWDFLWMPAILALHDRRHARPSTYDPGPVGGLPEGVTISTVHQLGVFLSRVWPCAWDGARGDEAAMQRFEAATRALLAREDLWAEDFAACSHWMPQYLWLGYWFASGRP